MLNAGIEPTLLTVSEHSSHHYAPRTYWNAANADVTLAFAVDFQTAGERLTRKAAGNRYVSVPLKLAVDPVEVARALYREVVRARQARTLNIAGNGIYTLAAHGIDQPTLDRWLFRVFATIAPHYAFTRVLSGGQTGVDAAGLAVAVALGIPALATLPAGCVRRGEDGIDRPFPPPDVHAAIVQQARALVT